MMYDVLQAKKMHISMCIKAILHIMGPGGAGYILVFLGKLMDLCADYATSSQILKAIRQAFPGRPHAQIPSFMYVRSRLVVQLLVHLVATMWACQAACVTLLGISVTRSWV